MEDIRKTGPVGLKGINIQKEKPIEPISLGSLGLSYSGRTPDFYNIGKDIPYYSSTGNLGTSKFDKTDRLTLEDISDVENMRAENQHWSSKWLSGLGKLGVLTTTTVVDNFLGTLAGIVNVANEALSGNIESGSEALNAFVDNPVSRGLQEINNWSEEAMPNYRTTEERDRSWWQNLGTANFWADGFLKNSGYFIGAYLSGAATSKMLTKAMQVDKMKQAFKGVTNTKGEALKTTSDILRAYKTGDAIMDGKVITDNLVSAAKKVQRRDITTRMMSAVAGSMGESRMEAINNSKDTYDSLYEELETARQRDLSNIDTILYEENPEWFGFYLDDFGNAKRTLISQEGLKQKEALIKSVSDYYDKEVAKLANEKISISNRAFLYNLAVTSLDNLWQFGEAFSGGFKQSKKLATVKKLANGMYTKSNADVYSALGDIGTSMVFEGGQEMVQEGINKAGERWASNHLNDYYGNALNPDALEAVDSYFGTLLEATKDTFTNVDDWENFFLGAITSLIPLPGSSALTAIQKAKTAESESKARADALNEIIQDPNKREWLYHLSRLNQAQKEQDTAIEENDRFSFKNASMDKAVSSVITYSQDDKFQDYIDIINDAFDVTEEDIDAIKAITIDKETGKSLYDGMTDDEILNHFKSNKEQAIENAKQIRDTYDAISILFGENADPRKINSLTYLASVINDRENRIKQITNDIINSINSRIDDFTAAYGYSPVEKLKDIGDLQTWFSQEDKKELLEYSLGKRTKESLKRADKASKKIDERQHRYRVLQGRKGSASRIIKELESKEVNGTITEEESNKLRDLKKKLKAVDRQMPVVRKTINDLKEFIQSETDKSNLQITEDVDKLQDLVYLINEREILVNNLNELQKNPEKLDEALSKDIINAYNSYIDRKISKLYDGIKKSNNKRKAILKIYDEGKISLERLQKIAEEKNDTDIVEEITSISKLKSLKRRIGNIFSGENNRVYKGDDPIIKGVVNRFKNIILNTIDNATTEKDALDEINNYIEYKIASDDEIESKIASNIKKALDKQKENTTTSSNKESTTEDTKDVKKEDKDKILELKNNPNREQIINNMSKKELVDFVISTGLYNQMRIDYDEVDSIDEENLKSIVLQEIDIYNSEEEEVDDEPVVTNDDIISIDSDTDPITAPQQQVVSTESTSDSVFNSSMKISNAEPKKADDYSENTKVTLTKNEEDTEKNYWTVGQKSSRYEIKPLIDPEERRLVERTDDWEVNKLINLKAYDFVDSGELSKLMLLAESVGKQLPVTFVQLRGQGDARKNADGKNHLFLAIDWEAVEEINKLVPEDKVYKKPDGYFENTFFKAGIDTKSKMQVIGKFDYDKTSKNHKKLLEAVQKEVDTIGYIDTNGNEKQTKFAASSIVTTLDWVFSGRLVKQNETFDTIAQRDLIDIIPRKKDSEELVNLDGEIQLAIITPRGEAVVGEDLDGEVIELNINRPQSPVTHSDRRLATPWIKIREADGRVYYKAVRIKKFDSSYTSDDSPIAQRIKQAIVNISKTTDETLIKNNLSILRNYLYIPAGKKLFVNSKNNTLNRGDQSISLNSSPEELYEFIKAQGYTFTFGLDSRMSLMDTINSNIFTTDLAQLHNANASMVIGKVIFNESGDYTIQPHDDLVNTMLNAIHLGKKGFQPGRGFSAPIKIYGDDNTYIKSDNGTYYIEVDGHREEAKDLTPLQKALIDFMISLPTRTDGYWYGGRRGSSNAIRILAHKIGNKTYYITDSGRILTDEEVKHFRIWIDKKVMKENPTLRKKAQQYLDSHLKGIPSGLPELTEEQLLESKKETIKVYMQLNNLSEISDSELRKLFKFTKKQVGELKTLLEEDDVFLVTSEGLVLREKEKKTTTPVKAVVDKKSNTKFKSRKKAARKTPKKPETGGNNVTTLSSEEIEKTSKVVTNLLKKIPTSLHSLQVEILMLLPNEKNFNAFRDWLASALSDKNINTNKIVEYYNKAFGEKFTNEDTVRSLLKEVKQTLEC